ncbi:Vacuolar morphogenesis protein 6 [Entomophthora muscae]|uniref:Vacuolar morphogenesis protein 6 n=1 Tax=Entomophthora muscae TaxID=34485 RepID=A0ACC2T705_9FUNG|nr:Vacuolar morphogenesis protein 6 [Entomophthora muscae]
MSDFSVFTGIAQLASDSQADGQTTPTLVTRVCIACKKQLAMLLWVDSEFVANKTQEYTAPDRVKSLEFLNADQVWLGFSSKDYWILDLNSGQFKEAVPSNNLGPGPQSPSATEKGLPDPSQPGAKGSAVSGVTSMFSGLAYSSSQYVSNYNPLGTMRQAAPRPLLLRISNTEMIVVKGEVGLFAGADGFTTRRTAIHFPVEPLFIAHSFPYLLIVSAKQVEVRNLDSQATVMTYPIDTPVSPVALTRGKSPFLATPNQVWRLVPTHFADQINTLISAKLFEEALTLFEQNKDRVSEVKTCSAEQIRELYALDLFQQAQFERALTMALDLHLPPTQMIGLYPSQISGFSPPTKDTSPDSAQWPQARLQDATQALIKYLTQTRTQLVAKLQNKPAGDVSAQVLEATLVDTTLVRCYLLINHAMIGPLLRVQNYVDIQVADMLLTQNFKYQELVDFYYAKGLHRKALQLLRTLGQADSTDKHTISFLGVKPTVQYMMRLGGDHFDLISEFSAWCLANDASNTMPLFIEDHITSHTLSAQGILHLLDRSSPRLAIEYLYHILPANYVGRPADADYPPHVGSDHPELHNQLAFLHIKILEKLVAQVHESYASSLELDVLALKLELLVWHPSNDDLWKEVYGDNLPSEHAFPGVMAEFTSTLRSLTNFLLADPALYKPEKLLGRLPTAMFFKPRAMVLSRLLRHDQALKLLVYRLDDVHGAEDYCHRFNSKDVFKTLLKVYLAPDSSRLSSSDDPLPSKSENMRLDPALQLLDRHGARIDAVQALDFLPEDVKMLSLGGFFTQNLRHLVASAHEARVQLSLLQAESVRLSCKLADLKADPITLDSTTLCPVCLKKIGTSAFAIFPDRQVVHYSCQTSAT